MFVMMVRPHSPWHRFLAAWFVVTVLGAAGLQVWAPSTAAAADEVPTVHNPRVAPAQRTVVMKEVWRVGGDDEAEYIFGVIGTALSDAEGNVYLLDYQQQQVFEFDPRGDFLTTVCRQGSGPGEIDRVYRMGWWDERTLGLLKSFPGSFVLVGTDGLPAGNLKLTAADAGGEAGGDVVFLAAEEFARRDGHLVCMATLMSFAGERQEQLKLLATFDDEGREIHRFGETTQGYDFSQTIIVDEIADYFPLDRWTLGPGGEVFLAPERDAYLIEVRDTSGALKRRFGRDCEPHRRSAAEKEEAKDNWSFAANSELPEIRYRIADTDPPIVDLTWIGDELWVATSAGERDRPEGVVARYDIHDREGRLIEERSYVLPLNEDEDQLVFLDPRRAVRIKAYRSAQNASVAGLAIQIGDERVASDGSGGEFLEVILYQAVE